MLRNSHALLRRFQIRVDRAPRIGLLRRLALLGGAGAATIALLAPATPAAAHGSVVESSPAAGSTVRERLSEIRLTFDEPPLSGFESSHRIRLVSPSGLDVSTGAEAIEDASLTKSVRPDRTGTYTVRWSAVSEDGHPVSGDYTFTYAGPVTSPPPSASPAPAAPADDHPGLITGPGALLGAAGGVVLLAAMALGLVTLRMRRRRRSSSDGPDDPALETQ